MLETVREEEKGRRRNGERRRRQKREQWDFRKIYQPTEWLGALNRENLGSLKLREQLLIQEKG